MDYAAIAKKFGGQVVQDSQPQTNKTPSWIQNLSQKDQAELQMKMHDEGRKRIAELDAEISKGSGILNELERFGQLNRRSRTGGVWENILPSVDFLHGADENEMQKIQARLGPAQREVGSGASSDRDVSLFMSGLPSVTSKGNVNKETRIAFQKKYERAVAKKSAMERYLNENGSLSGFDEAWANMSKAKAPPKDSGKKKMTSPKFLGFEE